MYGMTGKLTAQAGQRPQLVEILLNASQLVGSLPTCSLYAVAEELSDDVTVWVMEIWQNKASHDDSLKDEKVRALINQAMPLLGGPPSGAELNIMGGHGV